MSAAVHLFDLGAEGRTFDDLTHYAGDEGLHVEMLDEQPVYDSQLEEDIDCYVVVLLGDHIPGVAGTQNDMEEAEQFERREVWVSQPVEECGPMGAEFTLLDTNHQSWHELADLAQKTALELIN